jgi:hypothetical protein
MPAGLEEKLKRVVVLVYRQSVEGAGFPFSCLCEKYLLKRQKRDPLRIETLFMLPD